MRRDLRRRRPPQRPGLYSTIGALVCALVLPAAAAAAQPHAAPHGQPSRHRASGTIVSVDWAGFTIRSGGRRMSVTGALTQAADAVTAGDYAYVYGGGHAEAGTASIGIRGPGYNGRRSGYDCSGSVAAVLSGAGVWPAGGPVPNDAGIIAQLRQEKLIARGAGTGPDEVTLYDHPGVHIFMNIDGRFFGTSDGGRGGDAKGGPGWLDDGASDVSNPAFKRYHFVAGALKATTNAGYALAFQFGPGVSLLSAYPVGAKVRVVYKTTTAGTMIAQSVTLVGESTATGTVQTITPGGSSFTVATAAGQTLTFPAAAGSALAGELLDGQIAAGDTVSVSYIKVSGTVTVLGVTVTATPAPPPTVTSPSPPPSSGGQGV